MNSDKESLRGLPSADYGRVSSVTQIKKYGLKNQEKVRNKRTAELGLDRKSICIDPGCSGRVFNRPGLDKLIQDVKKFEVEVINTYTINRLGRVTYKLIALVDTLADLGVIAIVTKDDEYFLNDPRGREALIKDAERAERAWEELMENTQGGIDSSIDDDRYPFKAPFGMEKEDSDSIPTYKRSYVSIIQTVFMLVVKFGQNIENVNKPVFSRVAKELNMMYQSTLPGIFSNRKAKNFTGGDVARITRNKIYNGWIVVRGEDYKELKRVKIINDRVYKRTEKIGAVINSRYKTNNPKEIYPDKLGLERSLRYLEDVVGDGLIVVLCPHCRSVPDLNGSEEIYGLPFRKYRCSDPECNYEYLVNLGNFDEHKRNEVQCNWCGDHENFEIQKIDSPHFKYIYACKTCGSEQGNNFHHDKRKRKPSQRKSNSKGRKKKSERSTKLDDFL